MKSTLLNDNGQKTYALVFDTGDEIMKELKTFAEKEHLSAASFTAIGACSEVKLGFFDFDIKDYQVNDLQEQVEVLNMSGDIALHNKEPKIHAHIVVGKKDGTAWGGHLMEGRVHPTLEVILVESPVYLKREVNEETGLPLIVL